MGARDGSGGVVSVQVPPPPAVVLPTGRAPLVTSTVEFASAVPDSVTIARAPVVDPSAEEVMTGAAGTPVSITRNLFVNREPTVAASGTASETGVAPRPMIVPPLKVRAPPEVLNMRRNVSPAATL